MKRKAHTLTHTTNTYYYILSEIVIDDGVDVPMNVSAFWTLFALECCYCCGAGFFSICNVEEIAFSGKSIITFTLCVTKNNKRADGKKSGK